MPVLLTVSRDSLCEVSLDPWYVRDRPRHELHGLHPDEVVVDHDDDALAEWALAHGARLVVRRPLTESQRCANARALAVDYLHKGLGLTHLPVAE